jgi:hypothetical protein
MERHMPSNITVSRAAVVAGVLAVLAVAPALAKDTPSGTIDLKGGAVAYGVGFSWGGGTLHFKGMNYPLKIGGLSVVDIGASKYTATGAVYHLKNLKDVEGVYASATAGATVAGGASVQSMKNDKGVVIYLKSSRAGLQFTAAPTGVEIHLK